MPLTLWLTDRSRVETGLEHCARARYLGSHAGPHGYGWQKKAQAIPLVTGTLVHDPLAGILQELHDQEETTGQTPEVTAALVQHHVARAIATYEHTVATRGLALTIPEEELAARVREQTTLIAGLVWTWVRVALPTFLATYRIVQVEQEEVCVLGCDCGLGDLIGTAADHDARDCQGIGWMTRADLIAEHRLAGTLSYHEFKTTGDASANWEAQWKHRVQLVAGVLGAEVRLGREIDQVYIHALIKGQYRSEYVAETRRYEGPKYQNSTLVYGYRRPANPPLWEAEWKPKVGRPGKGFERTGIWELDPAAWAGSDVQSPIDYWVRALPEDVLADSYRLIGPIPREDWKLARFTRQLVAEEARWRALLWQLYELGEGRTDPLRWDAPEVQALLDAYAPQSAGSHCHSYYGDTCPFLPLCNREPGWETPELLGYIPRRPHHTPELDQAIGRGLLPPEDGAAEEREE